MEDESNKENKKITKERVIGLILILILFGSLIYIVIWLYQTNLNRKQIAELENQIFTNTEKIEHENKEDPEINKLIEKSKIDFNKLYEINSDMRGWLKIDALGISYPIVQYTDNQYYLEKDIYKKNNISGSIFLEYRNNGFEDKNTVLYGHNMKNDTMFGKLDEIGKGKVGTDIDVIIYTKDKIYKYKVFSAYEVEPKKFNRSEEIKNLLDKSIFDFQKEVDLNSKYLSLYTCTNTSDNRTIVHAYLEKEI